MFLVDTSAWIRSFHAQISAEAATVLRNIILTGACATCSVVILELLQGCRTVAERDELRLQLENLQTAADCR